jgi:hypothetical protein
VGSVRQAIALIFLLPWEVGVAEFGVGEVGVTLDLATEVISFSLAQTPSL